MNIIFDYPSWFILFCILAGVLYAYILYRKDKKFNDLSIWIVRAMASFRFLTVTILCFLLLSPLLKNSIREVEKPIIVIAQDNSESLVIGNDSTFYRNEYKQKLKKLVSQLASKYDIRLYSFADRIKELPSVDSLSFNEKQTDISSLFDEVETRYTNRNVGAIILATDGLYNKGSNPIYSADQLKLPIYTIALGDTTIKKDVIIAKVDHNRLAYLGNEFPIEVLVHAKQLKGKTSTLTISKGETVLFSQVINFNSESFLTTISVRIQAKEVGLQHYKVKLSTLPDEMSVANNFQDVFIDVLDARQKILILTDAPHPDVAAIKQSIESNQNYEVESCILEGFNKPLKKYNLVILYQLPSARTPALKIISELSEANIPIWLFSGSNAILKSDLTISSLTSKSNEVEPILDEGFPLFTISDDFRKAMKDFPAVTSPFGNYIASASSSVLIYQRIGIVDTKSPLISFNTVGDTKIAIFYGEGIWKWRFYDNAINGNTVLFDEFISKTVQYLSVKVDKGFFKIICKNNYLENETIEFEAEVYNDSYELINEPEVNLVITNSEHKKYPFTFSKTNNAYRLNAGAMPVGDYRYEAKVKVAEKMYTQRGEFSVSALKVELTNSVADHQLLYSLSKKHNGEMVYPNELEKLVNLLNNREDIKAVSFVEKKLTDLINLKWIFFLVLMLLSLEWFLRKRNGAY